MGLELGQDFLSLSLGGLGPFNPTQLVGMGRVSLGQLNSTDSLGDVIIRLNDEQVRITDILFVSKLNANLLSIKTLQTKKMIIKFDLDVVEITRDNQLVVIDSLMNKTYILKFSRNQIALVSTEIAKSNLKKSKKRDKYIL